MCLPESLDPLKTGIVHPIKAYTITSANEAANANLIEPILIGPKKEIYAAAEVAEVDIGKWKVIDVDNCQIAAAKACNMASEGKLEAIKKGALHSGELLKAIIRARGLRTERRASHIYTMQIPTYHKPFIVTDAGVTIQPDLQAKKEIIENAINLWQILYGKVVLPKIALLSAIETLNPSIPSTIDAGHLTKMSQQGQIKCKTPNLT
jgi:phosphotransacetylase